MELSCFESEQCGEGAALDQMVVKLKRVRHPPVAEACLKQAIPDVMRT